MCILSAQYVYLKLLKANKNFETYSGHTEVKDKTCIIHHT